MRPGLPANSTPSSVDNTHMASQTVRGKGSVGGDAMRGGPNYISRSVGCLKSLLRPAADGWQALPRAVQVALLVVAVPLSVLPLFLAILFFPPAFLLFSLVYSSLFGFQAFIKHVEDALREHCHVSEQVRPAGRAPAADVSAVVEFAKGACQCRRAQEPRRERQDPGQHQPFPHDRPRLLLEHHVHDARYRIRYPGKHTPPLVPHSLTCRSIRCRNYKWPWASSRLRASRPGRIWPAERPPPRPTNGGGPCCKK